MTIADAVKKYGISRQAIYQQLDKLPDKGRTGKKGEISEDGVKLLDSKYQSKQGKIDTKSGVDINLDKDTITALQAKIDEILLDKQGVSEKLEAAERKNTELQHELDMIRAERDRLLTDVAAAQADKQFLQAMLERLTRAKIEPAEPEESKRHWWQWWK